MGIVLARMGLVSVKENGADPIIGSNFSGTNLS